MLRRKLLMTLALGKRLGGLNEAATAVGIFIEIHLSLPSAYSERPVGAIGTSSWGYYAEWPHAPALGGGHRPADPEGVHRH
jgi:hypothetical protein